MIFVAIMNKNEQGSHYLNMHLLFLLKELNLADLLMSSDRCDSEQFNRWNVEALKESLPYTFGIVSFYHLPLLHNKVVGGS